MTRRYRVLSIVLILAALAPASIAVVLSHNTPCGSAEAVPAGLPRMKAIVYRCYGPPAVLHLEDIAKPAPVDDRMLIKVHAASVNPLDWHYMRGEPYAARAMIGMGSPNSIHIGVDFAGTVESVGKKVTRFKPGDEVFGGHDGAFAQYVSVAESGSLSMKPGNVTFEQAAAVPIAAVTALQALRDKGRIQAGQNVLINGASGGVGTFAVQLAKAFGANVTAVCSTRNLELVRSIGADHAIDYTREDFTAGAQRYDLVIDTVGTHSLLAYRRVLTPHGALVMVGSTDKGRWIGALSGSIDALLISQFVSQRFIFLLADVRQADLGTLGDLMREGKITPIIDRRYALSEVPEAMRYVELGHARGKVVITVE
jgi:NADPH:quinone reductase-like Zn-dependent oxidoreductase